MNNRLERLALFFLCMCYYYILGCRKMESLTSFLHEIYTVVVVGMCCEIFVSSVCIECGNRVYVSSVCIEKLHRVYDMTV